MKMSIAIIAACAGALVFTQADFAQAQTKPTKQTREEVSFTFQKGRSGNSGNGRMAAPEKPKQNREAIVTSRSNIKHQRLAAPEKPKQNRVLVNTSRSNIKHGAQ
jgi:uncharacterized low-complexity protein